MTKPQGKPIFSAVVDGSRRYLTVWEFFVGDPKYRIPRLDPLVIESLRVNQGTRQVGLTLECQNCSMYGLQNINFVKAKYVL